ncbi:hypothetical protein CYMTET_20437, partial [Cymbomonas tetramitiformis]
VGRTGRAGATGTAVTLVGPSDAPRLGELVADFAQRASADTKVAEGKSGEMGQKSTSKAPIVLHTFTKLKPTAVESLRYRAEDVARAVGKMAVKDARASLTLASTCEIALGAQSEPDFGLDLIKELRMELLNSEKLATRFEENEREKLLLQHDAPLAKHRPATHLRHIPSYIKDSVAGGEVTIRSSSRGNRGRKRKQDSKDNQDPLKAQFIKTTMAESETTKQALKSLEKSISAETSRPFKAPKVASGEAKKMNAFYSNKSGKAGKQGQDKGNVNKGKRKGKR